MNITSALSSLLAFWDSRYTDARVRPTWLTFSLAFRPLILGSVSIWVFSVALSSGSPILATYLSDLLLNLLAEILILAFVFFSSTMSI